MSRLDPNNVIRYLDLDTMEAYDRKDIFYHAIYDETPYSYTAFEVHQPDAITEHDLTEHIPPEHFEEIRRGERRVYFSNTHEAFIHMVFAVYKAIYKYDLPYEQVVIVSEMANIHVKIAEFAQNHGLPEVKSVWTRRFESDGRQRLRMLKAQKIVDLNVPNTLQHKEYTKKYLNFNRRWRFHRPLLTALLYINDLLDQGHVSLGEADDGKGWDEFEHLITSYKSVDLINSEIRETLKQRMSDIKCIPPMYLDTPDLVTNRAHIELDTNGYDLYEDTYFSLVSETNYYTSYAHPLFDTGVFLSEKIFKCIAYRHPFIAVSNAGFLKALRSIGYKTFSPWIDESYDDEEDNSLRMNMILSEVDRLCRLTPPELAKFLDGCKEICEYNFYLFMGKQKFYTQLWEENIHVNVMDRRGNFDYLDSGYLANIAVEINKEIANGAEKIEFSQPCEGVYASHECSPAAGFNNILKQGSRDAEVFHQTVFPELHTVHKILPMLDINPQAVKFTCATTNMDLIYERYCKVNDIQTPISVGTRNGFEDGAMADNAKRFSNVVNSHIPTPWQDKKKFLCYNRMPHVHRLTLMSLFLKNDIFDQGLISCHTELAEEGPLNRIDNSHLLGKGLYYQGIKQTLYDNKEKFPKRLELQAGKYGGVENAAHSINRQHFSDTFFSVVTETEFRNERNIAYGGTWNSYFTEKTFRTFIMKHPMIQVNCPFSLHYLREMGYMTFEKWLDESYDTVINDEERLERITMEVKRLCELPQAELKAMVDDMQGVLDYNYNVLMTKSVNQRYQ